METRAGAQAEEYGGRDNLDVSHVGPVLWISYDDELRSTPGLLDALCNDYLKRPSISGQNEEKASSESFLSLQQQTKYSTASQQSVRAVVIEIWQLDLTDDPELEQTFFKGLQKIGQALAGLRHLQLLKFSRNWDDMAVVDLRSRSAVLREVQQIQQLEDCPVGEYMEEYAAALALGHDRLEKIRLHGLPQDEQHALEQAILSLPNLQEFGCFFFNFLRPEFFARLISKSSMRSLTLHGDALSSNFWETFCQALAHPELCHLQSLRISFYRVPPYFARSLGNALCTNQFLTSLMLQPCSAFESVVLDEAGLYLGKSMAKHPCLQELDLRMPNRVSPLESSQWAQLLQQISRSRVLRTLSLTRFEWSDASMAAALLKIMTTTASDSLNLSICNLRCISEWRGMASALLQAYSSNGLRRGSCLQSLVFASPEFKGNIEQGEVILQDLATLLLLHNTAAKSSSLRRVHVSFPKLNCPLNAVVCMLKALHAPSSGSNTCTIESLHLETASSLTGDPVDDILSFRALLSTISSNYYLVRRSSNHRPTMSQSLTHGKAKEIELTIIHPLLPLPHLSIVSGILAMNEAGRRYVQTDPANFRKGVDVLAAVSENLDCLFFHLSENPFLFQRLGLGETLGTGAIKEVYHLPTQD